MQSSVLAKLTAGLLEHAVRTGGGRELAEGQKEAVKEKAMRAKANADLLAVVASHLAPLC